MYIRPQLHICIFINAKNPYRQFKGVRENMDTFLFSSQNVWRSIFSYSTEQCQLTISHSRHPGSQMHSNQSCLISPGWLSQPLTVTDWSVLRQPDIDMETTLMRTDLWDPARVGVWQSCQAFCLLGSSAGIKIKGRAKEIKAGTTYRTERYSSCLQMAINNLYNN